MRLVPSLAPKDNVLKLSTAIMFIMIKEKTLKVLLVDLDSISMRYLYVAMIYVHSLPKLLKLIYIGLLQIADVYYLAYNSNSEQLII